jgi:hypothetical protein
VSKSGTLEGIINASLELLKPADCALVLVRFPGRRCLWCGVNCTANASQQRRRIAGKHHVNVMRRVRYQLYVIGAVARRVYYQGKPETDDPGSSSRDRHPLTAGAGAVLCRIFIHARALGATVNFFCRETRLGRAGMRYLIDLTIVVLIMSFAYVCTRD